MKMPSLSLNQAWRLGAEFFFALMVVWSWPRRYPPWRVTWSMVMVSWAPLSLLTVTPSVPLATGPWGSGSLPLLLLGVVVFLGVVPPVGVRVISTRRLAARAWSVVSLILGSDSPLPETDVCHLSRLVSCSSLVLTALARFSDRVWL